ncbi:thioredoxin-like 3-2, chloroplastic isoform X2 [Malania oleifera]|uniref:thioredoxin-like 3-2, chloroplastic isoform X2 n=1 Tax=Malania oleifera TaxID=397392 RepID=UPI0025AE94F8|nr:thioredoxin-like 3-2, chloroplastic isoform X2 [Malania oleifera]
MSHSMRLSPSLKLSQSKNPPRRSRHFPISGLKSSSLVADTVFCRKQFPAIAAQITAPATAWREEGPLEGLDDLPFSVELGPICSETQFDRIVAEAQQLEESLIIVWMASWCRKCIHLKPKLEKLAADHYPRIRFYYVDVNAVPHRLVAHAGVTRSTFRMLFDLIFHVS